MVFIALTAEEYGLAMQGVDPELKKLGKILRKFPKERSVDERNKAGGLHLIEQLICRVRGTADEEHRRMAAPKSMRESIVVRYHDLCGHFAVDRTAAEFCDIFGFQR